MKIAFFCSCLEEGRDGVGDYVRQLAGECVRQSGGPHLLVALNDSSLAAGEEEREEMQGGMRVLRLNASLSWEGRVKRLMPELEKFDPDMVSFHYVPFAFHPRGLALVWPGYLQKLFHGRRLHWMFHEAWIGAYVGAPWKERVLGGLQRLGVCKVIRNWKPKVVHTSNPAYVSLLQDSGISATRLNMYGAIPEIGAGENDEEWFRQLMKTSGLEFAPGERKDFWFGLFFGTLHTNWPHQPLLGLLADAAKQQNKKVAILSLGYLRTGSELWTKMAKDYGHLFHFVLLGQKSPEEIARLFATVDFGITSSPANIIGKSSAAAAMFDHGLPVVTNWEGRPLRISGNRKIPEDHPDLVWKADGTLGNKLANLERRNRRIDPQLPRSARQLLQDMDNHEKR